MADQTTNGVKDIRKRLSGLIRKLADSYRESTQRAADQVAEWLQPQSAPGRPKPAVVKVPASGPVSRRRQY